MKKGSNFAEALKNDVATVHAVNVNFPNVTGKDDENMFPSLFESFVLPPCDRQNLDAISLDFCSEDQRELDIACSMLDFFREDKTEHDIFSYILEMESSDKAFIEENEGEDDEEEKHEDEEEEAFVQNIENVLKLFGLDMTTEMECK